MEALARRHCVRTKRFEHGDTLPAHVLDSMVDLTCRNMWLYAKSESVSCESYKKRTASDLKHFDTEIVVLLKDELVVGFVAFRLHQMEAGMNTCFVYEIHVCTLWHTNFTTRGLATGELV